MKHSAFKYFKTSPEIIKLAVMYYVRYSLSLRDVENILYDRGIDVTYESVRYWVNRFGPIFAREMSKNQRRQSPAIRWHLDEVFVKIKGETHYLWRAVDEQGEVVEAFVTKKRDKKAALKFLKKCIKNNALPDEIVTDRLSSYYAALSDLHARDRHVTGKRLNNRAENSHLPFRRRERALLRFRRMQFLQKFVSIHSIFYNYFYNPTNLSSRKIFRHFRDQANKEWSKMLIS